MDASDLRKIELEKKREKLAELRRSREFRRSLISTPAETSSSELVPPSVHARRRSDLDSLVSSLLGAQQPNQPVIAEDPPLVPTTNKPHTTPHTFPKPTLSLQPGDTLLFELPPLERVVYSKEIQTDNIVPLNHSLPPHNDTPLSPDPASICLPPSPETNDPPASVNLHDTIHDASPVPMSEDDVALILASEKFHSFLDNASRTMEKAVSLTEKFDFLRNYQIYADSVCNELTDVSPVSLKLTFYHKSLTKSRTVSSISWNPRFPELIAVAYTKSRDPTTDSDGLILVWNVLITDEPEYVLTCQSEVRVIAVSEYQPTLIVGGTYSGQINIWDTRSKHTSTPILRTSTAGHTHPITSSVILGTTQAHLLHTSASDGTLCTWQMDMLATPQECVSLKLPPGVAKLAGDVGITCVGVPRNEHAFLWIGTEHGPVVQVNKTGVVVHVYSGHATHVTAIKFHPPGLFSNLFLSTSMDWTVNLWRVGTGSLSNPSSPVSTESSGIQPVYSFHEFVDYVYDVAWSPVHPAVFATVDGSGFLDVWNLVQDSECYVARTRASARPLNKVAFSGDGTRIVVGGADGNVYMYDLTDDFLPAEDDHLKFQAILDEIEASSNEKPAY